MKSARTKYNRATKTADTISSYVKEFDYNWFFSYVASGAKFTVALQNVIPGVEGRELSISKYKLDEAGKAAEFLLDDVTFKPVP